ncbi:MAG: hypothetical protein Q4C42_10435 [Clostridia bacterium]|nr:hypothetical protein [Clostridia bacterium]
MNFIIKKTLSVLLVLTLIFPGCFVSALADEPVFRADRPKVSRISESESELNKAIQSFINDGRWSDGVSYTEWMTPLLWPERSSWGCCAYAIDFIIYVHGLQIGPAGEGSETYYNVNDIRVGDVLYSYGGWGYSQHYVCVCDIQGDRYLIAEGALSDYCASVGWYTMIDGVLYPDEDNIDPVPGVFRFDEGYHYN